MKYISIFDDSMAIVKQTEAQMALCQTKIHLPCKNKMTRRKPNKQTKNINQHSTNWERTFFMSHLTKYLYLRHKALVEFHTKNLLHQNKEK